MTNDDWPWKYNSEITMRVCVECGHEQINKPGWGDPPYISSSSRRQPSCPACAPGKEETPKERQHVSDLANENADLRRQLVEAQQRLGVRAEKLNLLADRRDQLIAELDAVLAEVASLTPAWTDGPPDRVGMWARETINGRDVVNVGEADLLRGWKPARWAYLGDIVEAALVGP